MYKFSKEELTDLLRRTIAYFETCDGVFNLSTSDAIGQTIEKMMDELDHNCHIFSIPFNGEPVPYEDDDNVSPAALGLQQEF